MNDVLLPPKHIEPTSTPTTTTSAFSTPSLASSSSSTAAGMDPQDFIPDSSSSNSNSSGSNNSSDGSWGRRRAADELDQHSYLHQLSQHRGGHLTQQPPQFEQQRYSATDPAALDRELGAEYLRLLAAVNDGRLDATSPASDGVMAAAASGLASTPRSLQYHHYQQPPRHIVPTAAAAHDGGSGPASAAADGYAESVLSRDSYAPSSSTDGAKTTATTASWASTASTLSSPLSASTTTSSSSSAAVVWHDAGGGSGGVGPAGGHGPAAECAPAPAALQDRFREMQDQLQRMQFQHDMLQQVRHPHVASPVDDGDADVADLGGHYHYLHHHHQQHHHHQHHQYQQQHQQQQQQQHLYHYYPHAAAPDAHAAFQPHVLPHRLASARRLLSMSATRHDAAAATAAATGAASQTSGGLPGNPLYQAVQDVLYPPPRLLPASLETHGFATPGDVLPRQRLIAAAASNGGGSVFDDPQRRFSIVSSRSSNSIAGYFATTGQAPPPPLPTLQTQPSIQGLPRSSRQSEDEARADAGTPTGMRKARSGGVGGGGVTLRTRSRSFGGDAAAQEALRLGWGGGGFVGGGDLETCVWWGSPAGPFGGDGEAIRAQLGERPVVELVILLGVLGHRAGSLAAQLQQQPAGSHPSVRLVGSAGNR
ncbi:hypothetical protein HK405_001007, partial [Cladochytrium tenue]